MTILSYRSNEPLYIVMLHNSLQAESIFKDWIKRNRVEHVQVTGHRMLIFDRHAFEKFKITWTNNTGTLTIWDTWLRKHVYLD